MLHEIRFALGTVLRSPERMRALLRGGPGTLLELIRFLRRIVPLSARALADIRARAARIPDDLLRAQALASVDGKAFHVAGACILANFLPE